MSTQRVWGICRGTACLPAPAVTKRAGEILDLARATSGNGTTRRGCFAPEINSKKPVDPARWEFDEENPERQDKPKSHSAKA